MFLLNRMQMLWYVGCTQKSCAKFTADKFHEYALEIMVKKAKQNDDKTCDLPFCLLPTQKKLDWNCCDTCEKWCHYQCVNITRRPQGTFECPICSM